MIRRAFITLLGGAAAWPVAARAQQTMPVVGFLSPHLRRPATHFLEAFRWGLAETGYIDGQNVVIEYHFSEGRYDQLPQLAVVTVIATPGNAVAALAAVAATKTIPIVFGVTEDPVRLGLVASLARPGGNATGINFFLAEIGAKRLGLLRELLVAANRVAVLVNPANIVSTSAARRELEPAARAMGLQIEFYEASTSREIDAAFAVLVRAQPDALFVAPDTFFVSRRVQLIGLEARHLLPATYPERDSVEAGGLMSYGTNVAEMYRQVGGYAGRILKGAKPADLPVVQTSTFELIINVQTARLLGIEVPPMLLARADEVIE